jgi:hypothetical protein
MKNVKEEIEVECLVCKTKFFTTRPWAKFCGEKCRNIHNNDKRDMLKGELPVPKCSHCKNDNPKLQEKLSENVYLCTVCAKEFIWEMSH